MSLAAIQVAFEKDDINSMLTPIVTSTDLILKQI